MYGSIGAPSLQPKYATNYIVLKEEVRKIFLDGFGSHLFDIKKVISHQNLFTWEVTSLTESKALRILSKRWKSYSFGRKASIGMTHKER